MRSAAQVCLLRALVVLAGLLPCAVAAAAQTGANDSGTFDVYIGGNQVGSEEFSIRQIGAGANSEILAAGRVHLRLATGATDLVSRLRTSGFQANPVSYEITVGGASPRRIVATLANGRVSSRILTPSGEQLREYLAAADAIVLDDGIAHQYYFLARRTRSGEVPVIIPRENRQVMATVTGKGEESVTVAGTTATLYHLVVQPRGGDERDVWVDALGRVIKVQIPSRNYLAVRTEVPD